MLTLPFTALPGISDLFIDYCSDTPEVGRYYLGHFSNVEAYEAQLHVVTQRQYQREQLRTILAKQSERHASGEQTRRNIDALSRGTTFAVVTGQQVGLFTGPVYTIYKALTAVHLCAWLGERFPAYDFVPVFWMESEDHDLDEANRAGMITAQNELTAFSFGIEQEQDVRSVRPVGGIEFDGRIEDAILLLADALQRTEFTDAAIAALSETYRPGSNFADAFARLFNILYPDKGIIFVDPSDADLKQILSPLILQELETYPISGEEVIKRSAELEERYHAQVKPRAVNLFHLYRGGRYPIEPSDYGFFLRGTRHRFTKEELLEVANVNPELFSPNVLLRPVFQDFLFPTVAYVAGPAEIAYFAQLQPVYDHFQVPMPIIFPRAMMTIIESKIQKLIDKFTIPYTAIFDEPDALHDRLFRNATDNPHLAEFASIKASIEKFLPRLEPIAAATDANLAEPARSTASSIQRSLTSLGDRLFNAHRERDATLMRQLEKMHVYLAPDGVPQERQINIITYLNRYGRDILARIDEACQPFPAEHRLLIL